MTTTADTSSVLAAPSHSPAPTCMLPRLLTRFSGEEIRARLDAAARKGKLPGLHLESPLVLFEVRELGLPFESVLVASLGQETPEAGRARAIVLRLRLRPLFPAIFAMVLLLSIWPGILLVDSMLKQYFTWYASVETWWWYLPLTVPTSPWALWSIVRKSRGVALTHAQEMIPRIAAELEASVAGPAGANGGS